MNPAVIEYFPNRTDKDETDIDLFIWLPVKREQAFPEQHFYPLLRCTCAADSQTSDFHIDLGHAEAGAELGNPDTAAIRGSTETRWVPVREAELSPTPSGANLLLLLPPPCPGRDLYWGKVRKHPAPHELQVRPDNQLKGRQTRPARGDVLRNNKLLTEDTSGFSGIRIFT